MKKVLERFAALVMSPELRSVNICHEDFQCKCFYLT